jgi:hypothetical protein
MDTTQTKPLASREYIITTHPRGRLIVVSRGGRRRRALSRGSGRRQEPYRGRIGAGQGFSFFWGMRGAGFCSMWASDPFSYGDRCLWRPTRVRPEYGSNRVQKPTLICFFFHENEVHYWGRICPRQISQWALNKFHNANQPESICV